MTLAASLLSLDFSRWTEDPKGSLLFGLVLLGGALLGGLLLGLVGKYSALLFWKELSGRAVLLLRLAGGIGGAIVAGFIGFGGGWGFGPGGGPGTGPGTGQSGAVALNTERRDVTGDSLVPTSKEAASVRILILGPETKPPYEEPDRFFRIIGEDTPRALTVPEVIDRLRTRLSERQVRDVGLEESKESTVFARPHVHTLRARVLQELRLPFSQPDFSPSADPLKDRVHYKPSDK